MLQGYGQTEAAPVISANLPGRAKLDTVGPPLDGVELRIAEDGEILVRGDLVMRGYWKDEEATAQALRDGWLHTGDIGELDADGYLKITDRKKDMIVNSGGDNVAPARVEGVLLLEPEIGQALIYGDRRPHLVALIVPHQEFVRSFARSAPAASPTSAALADEPGVQGGDRRGRRAAPTDALSPIERVRRFHVMPEPFSVENGFMTPTLKLRRHLIVKAHQELLEGLYGPGEVAARDGNAAPGQGSGAVVETLRSIAVGLVASGTAQLKPGKRAVSRSPRRRPWPMWLSIPAAILEHVVSLSSPRRSIDDQHVAPVNRRTHYRWDLSTESFTLSADTTRSPVNRGSSPARWSEQALIPLTGQQPGSTPSSCLMEGRRNSRPAECKDARPCVHAGDCHPLDGQQWLE